MQKATARVAVVISGQRTARRRGVFQAAISTPDNAERRVLIGGMKNIPYILVHFSRKRPFGFCLLMSRTIGVVRLPRVLPGEMRRRLRNPGVFGGQRPFPPLQRLSAPATDACRTPGRREHRLLNPEDGVPFLPGLCMERGVVCPMQIAWREAFGSPWEKGD